MHNIKNILLLYKIHIYYFIYYIVSYYICIILIYRIKATNVIVIIIITFSFSLLLLLLYALRRDTSDMIIICAYNIRKFSAIK